MNDTSQLFSIPTEHVSDTAFLVAALRVKESLRSDRLFDDSIADCLIDNHRTQTVVQNTSWQLGEWTLAIRTALLDQIIVGMIEQGIDTVVNLAAGLDTRPYRMTLPRNLKWIEADFPDILKYKIEKLQSYTPACMLECVAVDLANDKERRAFFADLSKKGSCLVISEGLLPYLHYADVDALSRDLLSLSSLRAWTMDMSTRSSFQAMRDLSPEDFSRAQSNEGKRVSFHFIPDEGIAYFKPHGWHVKEFHSFYDYGNSVGRSFPFKLEHSTVKLFSGNGIGLLTKS